jgi:hydrogenase large subunit
MSVINVIDPVGRIEGHLRVKIQVSAQTNGVIEDAWLTGTMFRGFENFLIGQEPLDAALITQRVCGVCPTPHALSAVQAMEDSANVQATPKGILMRNIINGAESLHSHILHSYHLALQDYIDISAALGGALNQGPWSVYGGDRRIGGTDLETLTGNYVAALAIRRKAHGLGAKLAGKQPHAASIIGGGCSATPSAADIAEMRALLTEIKNFVVDHYIPDMDMIFNNYYSDYFSIGEGSGKLLAYGAFKQSSGSSSNMLLPRGIYDGSTIIPNMDHNRIVEDIMQSWYTGPDGLHPSNGQTNDDPNKAGGYTWLKAPRYKTDGVNKDVYEVGPLARMVIAGQASTNISVADREISRTTESLIIANAMFGWLTELENDLSAPSFTRFEIPAGKKGVGLTEAGRGALGHWVEYDANGKVAHYQIITPTCWNASPKDADGVKGTIEQALIGVTVQDADQPVEALRVIHSYDPCLACAVHVIRDDGKTIRNLIIS